MARAPLLGVSGCECSLPVVFVFPRPKIYGGQSSAGARELKGARCYGLAECWGIFPTCEQGGSQEPLSSLSTSPGSQPTALPSSSVSAALPAPAALSQQKCYVIPV